MDQINMQIRTITSIFFLLMANLMFAQEKEPKLLSKAISKDNAFLTRFALLAGNDKSFIESNNSLLCDAICAKKLKAAKVLVNRNAKLICCDSEPLYLH